MSNYLKFFRSFLVLMVGILFLVGCTPEEETTAVTPTPTETIEIVDSTKESIAYSDMQQTLENNETTYSKSFTLDDKKTEVKISFDLLENNVTEDLEITVDKFDYQEDVIWAKILKINSTTPLQNIDIDIVDTSTTLNKLSKSTSISYKRRISSTDEAIFAYKNNFQSSIKSTKLSFLSDSYVFTLNTTKELEKMRVKVDFGQDESTLRNTTEYKINLTDKVQ